MKNDTGYSVVLRLTREEAADAALFIQTVRGLLRDPSRAVTAAKLLQRIDDAVAFHDRREAVAERIGTHPDHIHTACGCTVDPGAMLDDPGDPFLCRGPTHPRLILQSESGPGCPCPCHGQ